MNKASFGSRSISLWIFTNWKSICQIICCIQLFIITIYILFFTSLPCDNDDNIQYLAATINNDNDNNNNDNDLSLYPVPVNSKDFTYDNNDKTSISKLIEFSNKISSIYSDHGDSETIFIALASYRDDECVKTIINAFETAMYPDRLRFGIFQQHNITDGDCTDYDKLINCDYRYGIIHPLCGRMWQIQIDRIDFKDAKGPLYGRYRAELFYSSEDYVLQIDAHTRFVPHFDNILIDMFKRINNDNAVFTTYPKATDEKTINWLPPISRKTTPVVAICKTKILDRSFMFKHERGHFVHNPSMPVLTIFFAAGFSFAKGHRILNVPSDPYLPYLFDGEEILMTTRLFTNGYDLFMPDRDIIFHIYEEHRKRPLFWHDDWNRDKQKFEKKAQNRLLYILNLLKKYKPSIISNQITFNMSVDIREIKKYSLGNQRDINDYWKWIKMDFDKKESADFCTDIQKGKIQRLPTKTLG